MNPSKYADMSLQELIGYTGEELLAELETEQWVETEPDCQERLMYLGTCFGIMPSGKYYMPWACSNVTELEADADEDFREALEERLGEIGLWLTGGEGDPCDMFVGQSRIVEPASGMVAS